MQRCEYEEQDCKYQRAVDAGPQQSNGKNFEVAAAHPSAGIEIDQEGEYDGRESDIPPGIDPPARRDRMKREQAGQQEDGLVSDLVVLEIRHRGMEEDCSSDHQDDIGEVGVGNHEASSRMA